MGAQYRKSVFEYLSTKTSEGGYSFKVVMNSDYLLQKLINGDWSSLPCLVVSGLDSSMSSSEVTVLADDMSDMLEVENAVAKWLGNAIRLQITDAEIEVSIDGSRKIERSSKELPVQQGTRTLYQSLITLKAAGDVVGVKAANDENSAARQDVKRIKIKPKVAVQAKPKAPAPKPQTDARMQFINRIFSTSGDSMTNVYTDAVVADIKARLNLPYEVSVYGGSTFSQWNLCSELGDLEFPCVLIKDSIGFRFDRKVYRTTDKDGKITERPITTDILPINYAFNVEIYAKTEKQLSEIVAEIQSRYAEKSHLPVALSFHDGEVLDFELLSQKILFGETKLVSKGGRDVYFRAVPFFANQAVYFVQPYSEADIQDNHRLQINLLKLAVFYGERSNKMEQAIKMIDDEYSWMLGLKFSLLGFINSQGLKTLKACYAQNRPLDRNLFDTELEAIVSVYPDLYDQTVRRVPVAQIRDEIRKYQELFNDKFVEWVDLLGVPDIFEDYPDQVPYSFANLQTYAQRMEKNPKLTLKKAINMRREELLEEKRLRRLELERARRNYEANREYSDDSRDSHESDSSEGGLFSGLFKSKPAESGKQSLWGTGMCPYGKKDENGWSIFCPSCYLRVHCSGKPDDADRHSLWGTGMCPYGKKDEKGWSINCNSCYLMWHCSKKP